MFLLSVIFFAPPERISALPTTGPLSLGSIMLSPFYPLFLSLSPSRPANHYASIDSECHSALHFKSIILPYFPLSGSPPTTTTSALLSRCRAAPWLSVCDLKDPRKVSDSDPRTEGETETRSEIKERRKDEKRITS